MDTSFHLREGKYVVMQYEDQVYVYHNTTLDEPAWIMNISAVTKDEWKASVEAGVYGIS